MFAITNESRSYLVELSDIQKLTGYGRAADQVKWLERHGWVHEVNSRGQPIVSVSYFEQKLGKSSKDAVNEPDFSIMTKRA